MTDIERGPTAARARASIFRGDIDGLRALAILIVVGFHIGLPLFSGGFIGVDVFFVISGYLITRNLLRESTATGRVALGGFWGRRVRRLVPAMALMLLVTLALAVVVLPRVDLPTVARQAGASALYVSNILFARDASNYFAPNIETSPYLHTWSLGVEEQFYLLWPVLVALGCLATRRRPAALRRVLVGGFGALLVASFALCLLWSSDGSSWAFFSLPTRAWEFAAAGLLVALPSPRLGPAVRTGLTVIGLVVLAVATVALSDIVGYPGAYALAPVGATLLLLVAGTTSEGQPTAPLSQALAVRPLQWLGRVSYSWYLWHWPFIVLFASAFDDDRVRVRLMAVLVALPIAALAHHFVENPVRFSRALTTSLPRTFAVGAVVTLLALAGAFSVARYSDWRASRNWLDEQLASARADLTRYECPNEERSAQGIQYCSVGDPHASTTVMLVGDSHARHWTAALSEVANDLDAHLITRWRGACPATLVKLVPRGDVDNDQGCQDYREDTLRLLDELRPAIVVIAQSDNYQTLIDVPAEGEVAQARADAWGAAYGELLDRVEAVGARPAVILDNPGMPRDPVDCISRRRDVESCTPSRSDALHSIAPLQRAERAQLATRPDVPVFDPTEVLCDDTTCAVVKNDVLVYSDLTHLTEAFTRTQKDRLTALLTAAWPR